MIQRASYIVHHGRIMRVRAHCKTNGLPAVLAEDDGGARFIIPLAQAVEASAPAAAPQRRVLTLVVDNTRRLWMPFDPVNFVETKPSDLGKICRRAATIIEQRGWCQAYENENGAVCIGRALVIASDGDGWDTDILNSLAPKVIPEECVDGWDKNAGAFPLWNDHPSRTVAEVIARLRSIA